MQSKLIIQQVKLSKNEMRSNYEQYTQLWKIYEQYYENNITTVEQYEQY